MVSVRIKKGGLKKARYNQVVKGPQNRGFGWTAYVVEVPGRSFTLAEVGVRWGIRKVPACDD